MGHTVLILIHIIHSCLCWLFCHDRTYITESESQNRWG